MSAGAGGVRYACECTHLSDFVLIEFRSDGLVQDLEASMAAYRGLSGRAAQCLAEGADVSAMPFGWYAIAGVLTFNVLGLANAWRRDRRDGMRVRRQKTRLTRKPMGSPPAGRSHNGSTQSSKSHSESDDTDGNPPAHRSSVHAGPIRGDDSWPETDQATVFGATLDPSASVAPSTPPPSPPSPSECHCEQGNGNQTSRDTPRVLHRIGVARMAMRHPFAPRATAEPPARISAKERWASVASVHTRRGQRSNAAQTTAVDHFVKRASSTLQSLHLAFKSRHTLLAGVVYNGALGYTRSQTVQVLSNSLALELVIVCMTFVPPEPGAPLVIQPVVVVIHGLIAGLLCIPGMLLFAWLFDIDIVARIIVRMLFAPLLYLRWKMRANRLRAAECVAPLEALAPGSNSITTKSAQTRARPHSSCTTSIEQSSSTTAGSHMHTERQGDEAVLQNTSGESAPGSGRWSSGSGLLSSHRFRRSRRRRRGNSEDHQIGVLGMCLGVVAQERKRQRTAGKDNAVARIWARLRLPFGWFLNWCTLCGLLVLFLAYLCEFSAQPDPLFIQRELLWTWGFSICQRFLINEPFIIIASKLAPKMLRSRLWYACFSERCIESTSALVFAMVNALRFLARP